MSAESKAINDALRQLAGYDPDPQPEPGAPAKQPGAGDAGAGQHTSTQPKAPGMNDLLRWAAGH